MLMFLTWYSTVHANTAFFERIMTVLFLDMYHDNTMVFRQETLYVHLVLKVPTI